VQARITLFYLIFLIEITNCVIMRMEKVGKVGGSPPNILFHLLTGLLTFYNMMPHRSYLKS